MPEEQTGGLEEVLDALEDYTWNKHNYQTVQDALNTIDIIKASALAKLLSKCVRSLKEDVKYTSNTLNIISSVLKKVKASQCDMVPDLVPSAVAVLHVLKTTALFNKVEALKIQCFEIILSYPDNTLVSVVIDHSTELMELFNLYCHQQIPIDIRFQPINIIAKLLKILPPDKKTIFVKEGISIWFSKIVPTVVLYLNTPNARVEVPMEALELLTEELVHIDYSNVPQWHIVLECISTPQRYPSIMKSLLEKDNEVWYRLWIVFIKLLKDQITKVTNPAGSPINSMLPVVEMAFKMHSKNRCRAFICWNVLIDNFSTETNEVYINKRIKLLIIPLMSNNAKVEETALAKLQTWWHLIDRFCIKLDKTLSTIVIPFLHFCFGKPLTDRPVLIPGTLTDETRKQCSEAFVELLGHYNCTGCVNCRKLQRKLINTVSLVDHWKDWIHSLTIMTKNLAQFGTDSSKAQIKCAWKSYLATLGELPESRVKQDLFSDLLSSVDKLANGSDRKLAEATINNLLPTLFDDDEKIKSLFKVRDNSFTQRIMKILSNLTKEHNLRTVAVSNIKPITNFIVCDLKQRPTPSVDWVLKILTSSCMLIWTALAESMFELKYDENIVILSKMLFWPLKNIDLFSDVKESTSAWLNLYNFMYPKSKTVNKDILNALLPCKFKSSNHFVIEASIAMLNQKLSVPQAEFDKEAELLFKASNLSSWMKSEDRLINMINVITIILKKLTTCINVAMAENTMTIIKQLLGATKLLLENVSMNESSVLELLEDLLQSLENMLKMEKYSDLRLSIVHELQECAPLLRKRKSIIHFVKSIYNNMSNTNAIKLLYKELEVNEELNDSKSQIELNSDLNKFTTPDVKSVAKKSKKREASIVDTVVENGEEYVVVKSNWKFNPRKLTDNQKEKLRRKREDIPALYQDLSQSQDEFKLNTWKTDSQDSSSTSKSASMSANEDVTTILKNIPNTEIVPKILEHIKPSKEALADNIKLNEKNNPVIIHDPKVERNNLFSTLKETKSPRLALKDRIFRNVRNLKEKSTVLNENKDLSCSVLENVLMTPLNNKIQDRSTTTNSAPPKISTDRPLRTKRKPKKFDDLEVYALKKRRCSSGQNDSQIDPNIIEINDENSSDNKEEPNDPHEVERLELNSSATVQGLRSDLQESSCTSEHAEQRMNERILDADTLPMQKLATSVEQSILEKSSNFQNLLEQIVPNPHVMTKPQTIAGFKTEKCVSETQKVSKNIFQSQSETISKLHASESIESTQPKSQVESKPHPEPVPQEDSKSQIETKHEPNSKRTQSKPLVQLKLQPTQNNAQSKSQVQSKQQSETNLSVESKSEVESKPQTVPQETILNTQAESKLVVESKTKKELKPLDKLKPAASTLPTEFKPQIIAKSQIECKTKSLQVKLKPISASKSPQVLQNEPNRKVSSTILAKPEQTTPNHALEKSGSNDLKEPQTKSESTVLASNTNQILPAVHDLRTTPNLVILSESQDQEESHLDACSLPSIPIDSQSFDQVQIIPDSQSLLAGQQCNKKNLVNDIDNHNQSQTTEVDITLSLNQEVTNAGTDSVLVKTKKLLGNDSETDMLTPKAATRNKNVDGSKSSQKSTSKISRIEKALAIDMVEGHPYLKEQSFSQKCKRLTRKSIMNSSNTRKNVVEKLNKSKQESKKNEKKTKDKNQSSINKEGPRISDEIASQDFIESSQDTTITTISTKSTKSLSNKVPLVCLQNVELEVSNNSQNTQDLIDCENSNEISTNNVSGKDDTELPRNKTFDLSNNKDVNDLMENCNTEVMDTEPLTDIQEPLDEKSGDVIFVSDEEKSTATIDAEVIQLDFENTVEADTQSMDPNIFSETSQIENQVQLDVDPDRCKKNISNNDFPNISFNTTPDDITQTVTNVTVIDEGTCSPVKCKGEVIAQRKKEFFNDTLEISPIKTMSPVVENEKTPEENSDYVVIKLTEPVQNNGEPFEKFDSPEVFTEDKISPDKRNQSPPREDIIKEINTSPSSSLSLKKNRPQVRSGGRGAQMLGLCVPDKLQTMLMSEKQPEQEDSKKNTPISTSARRNLRILYNTTENNDNSEESEESENFLKLKRSLPSTNCSPSGPILKRKLADIIDDATVSPASKRKRVSFHDPPVSTTICVKKYIEPLGIRSPQNSVTKRQERQAKAQVAVKSPKKLESLFRLETVLTKTIESFSDETATPNTNDTDMNSLETTPVVEIVKISDLDDTEPVCLDLINCEDPIENIATELSSPTMKSLLVKEFEGKVDTIGDLAKMTELQINRLCIKAPKVQIAKKVLSEYAEKVKQIQIEITPTVEAAMSETIVPEFKVTMAVQTDDLQVEDVEMQTDTVEVVQSAAQTETIVTLHSTVQTDESGSKSTTEIIKSCLQERLDFMDKLYEEMDENYKQKVAETLPFNTVTNVLIKKMTECNSTCILEKVLDQQCSFGSNNGERRLSMLKEYLCGRFESRDLVLFCSEILKKVYEKPS